MQCPWSCNIQEIQMMPWSVLGFPLLKGKVADKEMRSVCGLRPREDVKTAAIVMWYHNRCVSTKQHEDLEVEIFWRKDERLGKGWFIAEVPYRLFSSLAFTLQVHMCLLVCTASIKSERSCLRLFAPKMLKYWCLPLLSPPYSYWIVFAVFHHKNYFCLAPEHHDLALKSALLWAGAWTR